MGAPYAPALHSYVMLLIPLSTLLYNQYIKPDAVLITDELKKDLRTYLSEKLDARLLDLDSESGKKCR